MPDSPTWNCPIGSSSTTSSLRSGPRPGPLGCPGGCPRARRGRRPLQLQTPEWDSGRVDGRPPRAGPVRRPADDLAPAGQVAGQGLDRPRRERLVGLVVLGDGPARPRRLAARWIGPHEPERPPAGERPAHLLRQAFTLDGDAGRARVYATAHGLYELVPERHPGRRPRADAGLHLLPVPPRRPDLRRHRPARPGRQHPLRRADRRLVPGPDRLHPGGRLLRDGSRAARPARGRARGRHPGHPRHRDPGWTTRHGGDRRRRPHRRRGGRPPPPPGRLGSSRLRRPDLGRGPGRRSLLRRLTSSPAPPVRRVEELRPAAVHRIGRGTTSSTSARTSTAGSAWSDLGPDGTTLASPTASCSTRGRGDDRPPPPVRLRHPGAAAGRPGRRGRLRGAGRGAVRAPPHDPRLPVRRHRGPPGAAGRRRRAGVVVHTDLAAPAGSPAATSG